jgi:biopolymer transport protein ExbB
MAVLITTSIISLTFMVERGLALRWRKVIPLAVEEAVGQCRSTAELPILRRICEQNPSALSRLLVLGVEHLNWPKSENAGAMQTKARHEIARLERGLVVLEIVIGIAPLLGLVGTIYGLVKLFGTLGESGMADNSQLAGGISLALYATLMGLLIAIPSLVVWSYLTKKVETLAVEMESLCDEFLHRIYRIEEKK